LERFSQQLNIFTQRLEEFASKHRDEIRKNSQFRRHFQEMCGIIGVDPLACKLYFVYSNVVTWFQQARDFGRRSWALVTFITSLLCKLLKYVWQQAT
jgi:hypothetical protein